MIWRVVALKLRPAGSAGEIEYVRVPVPPAASGRVSGSMPVPTTHVWLATVVLPKLGVAPDVAVVAIV